jgi:NADH-quinone oxidoreductase subunit M
MAEIRAMRKDLSLRESVVVAPLIALLLILGVYPKPLLDVINPAVAATLQDVGATSSGTATAQEVGK